MAEHLTEDELRAKVREHIRYIGTTQKSLAEALGVSAQHMSDFLRGNRAPGQAIARGFGYERIVLYRPRAATARDDRATLGRAPCSEGGDHG